MRHAASPRIRFIFCSLLPVALIVVCADRATAQYLVPGMGYKLTEIGDDFEDSEWKFETNLPKGSRNLDGDERHPLGESKNNRWYEGPKRGHPDHIVRVTPPEGGLPGSKGAMLLQSITTGIPGRPSYKMQQDDLMADFNEMEYSLDFSQAASVVIRIYMPPFEKWEKRSGATFALRTSVEPIKSPHHRRRYRKHKEIPTYWPGIIIDFMSKADGHENDGARFRIRADRTGHDFDGPWIKQTGWWTLGMSYTPNGQVHYFASPGVDKLTANDYISSQFCYGDRGDEISSIFFCICSPDDGKTWSTEWIVDDVDFYVMRK